MYNRYIPSTRGYTRVVVEDAPVKEDRSTNHREQERRGQPSGYGANGSSRASRDGFKSRTAPLSFFAGEDKNAGMAGILKLLHLEELDSGDVLLLLIILFLFLEGDNIELVITLGLMLLLGLGDEKKDQKE